MTNLIKAPRPCKLPKGWEGTGLIDSNKVYTLEFANTPSGGSALVFKSGWAVYSKVLDPNLDFLEEKRKAQLEVALAITSAQRPWLKAEGYQFNEGQVYQILHFSGAMFFAKMRRDNIYAFNTCWSDGSTLSDISTCYITRDSFLAFKPISDSQEAWDKLAGVEVYKEGK